MKIRAAVLYEQGKPMPYAKSCPFVVEEVELDGPGPGELLVQIAAAGLCHSDLSAVAGMRARAVPTVGGHESSAVVREVGPGVTCFKPGDHVVMVFVASCGHCVHCYSGRPNLCESSWDARTRGTLQSGARRLHIGKQVLNHWSGLSCFAEYAVVSQNSLVRIDPDIPLEDAAGFGCAVITGVGAVVNTAKVPFGSTVAVVGLGGVGLSALLGAHACGASRVIAVDISEDKLRLARELGATDTFNAKDPKCVEAIREATSGGVAYAFEMSGVSAALSTAYSILRRGGMVVVAGLPDPKQTFAVPISSMVSDERCVRGSYMGSCVPQRDIPLFVDLYRRGRLPVNRLRSGTVSLETINEGFDRLARGETVRDILVFKESQVKAVKMT
jgi:alcohol dehydrogenase